jgi:hypothetical protein
MLSTQGTAQDLEAARAALVIGAIVIAAFWRTIIRIVVAVLVALVMVLLGFGAIMLVHAMQA